MTRHTFHTGLMLAAAVVTGCSGSSSGIGGSGAFNVDDNRPHVNFASYGGAANILDVVGELQRTAKASNRGTLGCGVGTVTIRTSQGVQSVQAGLSPIQVFGANIDIAVVHELLESRAASNRTGKRGPMSKNVDDLCYVALYTLEIAHDPKSVPLLMELRSDKSEIVRFHADSALQAIAEAHPELRAELEKEASELFR